MLKIAIIGCGAVARIGHIPAALGHDKIKISTLIDKKESYVKELAKELQIKKYSTDYKEIINDIDAAIIATPPSSHALIAKELIQNQKHILLEKPMAINKEECDDIIAAARQNNTVLGIGFLRRFSLLFNSVKLLLKEQFFGKIKSFEIEQGEIYEWPVESEYLYNKEVAGGGVLADSGSHVLDMICWWFGDIKSLEYCDDNYGGVEANCKIDILMKNDITGTVKLSRTHNLSNEIIIHCQKATVKVSIKENIIKIKQVNSKYEILGNVALKGQNENLQTFTDLFSLQMNNWYNAIIKKESIKVNGEDGQKVVILTQECYNNRKKINFPWL